jgi:mannose-6-phosphate isomerase-like protein (cupin superfamily)
MEAMKDGSHLYEVEHRAEHTARRGFRITELQISSTQKVPWHCHTYIQDTFYVIEGRLRLFLREPKEEVQLGPGETYSVKPRRPHLVTNAGSAVATFLVLQGIGQYDFCRSPSRPSFNESLPPGTWYYEPDGQAAFSQSFEEQFP